MSEGPENFYILIPQKSQGHLQMPLLEETLSLSLATFSPTPLSQCFCTNYEPRLALWAFQSVTLA